MSTSTLPSDSAIGPRERERARLCLLDWLGVAIAGAERARSLFGDPPVGRSPLIGGGRTSPEHAVMRNAVAGHILDYDDTMPEALAHPSAVLWPALIADGLDGERLITAFLRGVTALAGWGRLYASAIAARRGHPTSSLGMLAVVHALTQGRGTHEISESLRLAGALAGGSQSVFGGVGKALQVGISARTALDVVHTRWPGSDSSSEVDPLRVPGGFAERVAGGGDRESPAGSDGGREQHPVHGVVHKFHASCYATHGALDAFRELAPAVHDIDRVEVRIGADFPDVASGPWPQDGLALKFSVRACLALAMSGADTADPGAFDSGAESDPVVRELARSIRGVADPSIASGAAVVCVRMSNGEVLQAAADPAAAVPSIEVLRMRVLSKFHRLTDPEMGAEPAHRLAAFVLEDLEHATADRIAAVFCDAGRSELRKRADHDDR